MGLSVYRATFFANRGVGPYSCFGCGEDVTMDEVAIHHIDHDHNNNILSNLAPMHPRCHSTHHRHHDWDTGTGVAAIRGQTHSHERRRKAAEGKIGLPRPDVALRNRTEQAREHASQWASKMNRMRVPCRHGCGRILNPGAEARHATACPGDSP